MALAAAALLAGGAAAQHTAMDVPMVDEATVIANKLGAVVAGDLQFVDEMKRRVQLSDYFGQDRPIILNLGYYGCPKLCGFVTEGLVNGVLELDLEIGNDFEIITVSIDPNEKPPLARDKKNSYLARYTAARAEDSWHFLTGEEDQIRKLTETVGFNYRWNEFGKQWDHSAGIMILSAEGKLIQVLKGVNYEPRTLRLALVEASEGRVGTTWDRLLLTCYGYNPVTGEYNLMVWVVVRTGGVLTVLGIAIMIFVLWRRERRGQLEGSKKQSHDEVCVVHSASDGAPVGAVSRGS